MAALPIHHPLAATTREPVREPARAQRPVGALIVKSCACLPNEGDVVIGVDRIGSSST